MSEVDFEAVSEGVLDAIRPVVEREMREAANQFYGATMEAVQDYLSDNVSFNIRSRLDAAERDRRTQWDRAERLEREKADLLEASASLLKSIDEMDPHQERCSTVAYVALTSAIRRAQGEGSE